MSDDPVRRALASLARSGGTTSENGESSPSRDQRETYRETIEHARTAIEDVEAAAQFVEEVGVDELERAVERAERSVSACATDGQRALTAFREFREAAEGVRASEPRGDSMGYRRESIGDHFHPGHGTSLGGGDIAPSK